jgi:RNA polymerase sigma-70 factor, ECF subfamily
MHSVAHATIGSVFQRGSHGNGPEGSVPVAQRPRVVAMREEGAAERVGSKTDDETLVRETLAGKRWAQRELWYRFAPMVHGLLRRTLSSRIDHDDLVQEVFLRVFRRLHTLEKASALRSFIYSVAVRVVSEEIRHFCVLKRVRDQLELIKPDAGSTGADFEARDALVRVQRLLDEMKDKHRAVFVLRHVEGLELREIATGLDLSLATVKRYLVKATRSLHQAVFRDEGLAASLSGVLSAKNLGGAP